MKTTSVLLAILTVAGAGFVPIARAAEKPARLLPLYEKVSTALAADDLTAAQSAACALAVEAGQLQQKDMAQAATAVGKAANLAAARTEFKTLSSEAMTLARQEQGYFLVHCPMADADWVQSTRAIANPYLGKDMATCGVVTEETKG